LDRVYAYHATIGIWSFCLILLHPFLEAIRWFPEHPDQLAIYLFPLHGRLSMNIGSIAFWLMIVIIGTTLLKVFPYHIWKRIHKLMPAVFILGSFHVLLSDARFVSGPSKLMLLFPMSVGILSVLYRLWSYLFFKKIEAQVLETKRINENVLQITIAPKEKPINFVPGQYGFFYFLGPGLTKEAHPYTLIESLQGSKIDLLVKVRGDYTKTLFDRLEPGYVAKFEGPYGRFDYRKAGKSQIWIAGGIGIVPFIAWIRALPSSLHPQKIDLYYCVHNSSDAVFYDEFHQFSQKYPYFNFHFHCSEEDHRLTISSIQSNHPNLPDTAILLCGPKKLTADLTKKFQKLGVKRENILFEDFEFF
jgi:predicted ferric reductase